MATKEVIYILESGDPMVIALTVEDALPSMVWEEWRLSRLRAEGQLTLSPENRPKNKAITLAAVEDLQARRPSWRIIYGPRVDAMSKIKPDDEMYRQILAQY